MWYIPTKRVLVRNKKWVIEAKKEQVHPGSGVKGDQTSGYPSSFFLHSWAEGRTWTSGIPMLGSQGHIHTPLTVGILEVAILPICYLPTLPFLQTPFPLPQEHTRGIQALCLADPVILYHSQDIQDASPQIPTPLHTRRNTVSMASIPPPSPPPPPPAVTLTEYRAWTLPSVSPVQLSHQVSDAILSWGKLALAAPSLPHLQSKPHSAVLH